MGGDGRRHLDAETLAVDGERTASGYACAISHPNDERPYASKLLFEQSDGIRKRRPTQRVGANQLGQPVADLRRCSLARLLLDEGDVDPSLGQLPGRLASGK